jgi:hypothetical protein
LLGDLYDPLGGMVGKPIRSDASDDDSELGLTHAKLLAGN